MRVFVEPEADRVLWLHVRVLLVLDQGEGRGLCVGPYKRPNRSSADLLWPASQIGRYPSCPSKSYRWQRSISRSEAMTGQFPNDPDPGSLRPADVSAIHSVPDGIFLVRVENEEIIAEHYRTGERRHGKRSPNQSIQARFSMPIW